MGSGARQTLAESGEGLQAPLQYVKGVGPVRAKQLARLGLHTIEDALYFIPFRHEDRTRLTALGQLVPGEVQSCAGTIVGISPPPPGRRRAPFSVMLRDPTGQATASWFNAGYLDRVLKRGQRLVLHGKVARYRGMVALQHPDFEVVDDDDDTVHTGRLVPIYHSTEGLPQRLLRTLMRRLVTAHAADVADPVPDVVRTRRHLPSLSDAVRAAHFPDSEARLADGRRRLAFDDFLLQQLGVAILRARTTRARGIAMAPRGKLVALLRAALPYALTAAQERVWTEVRADMASAAPMHRLLQGDVGSGKTIVAALAVLTAVEAGYQTAVMAPTEILAEQHLLTFRRLLGPLGIEPGLVTAGVKGRERAERLTAVAAGELPCVVGTHALVQEGVQFRRLGLAVVDEQHRFGVAQRARLRAKGEHPDLLVMTATPIPRTLALTLYGDLDVSVLDELPPGRHPVITVTRPAARRERIYAFVREQVAIGRQAYIVYPLVEESEALDVQAATERAGHLRDSVFPDLSVGLLHGRMPVPEKDAVMRRFKAGDIHVLVATSVIEVGIDVPNASVMLIEHAERFGLSQLHQLRGRVGRGPWKSYCILLTGPKPSQEARERIAAMTRTDDGFRIAEADLRLRGPGEFFGTRQSGMPGFRVADLLNDAAVLEPARQEALRIIAADPELLGVEHRGLRRALLDRWRGKLDLASVG
jgi:ATP-dependent DNA helicase RecG